jgi:rhamnogalacturonyl hydrolase YesR
MKRIFCYIFLFQSLASWAGNTYKEVLDLIDKVNSYWQNTHPEPGNAFWHSAAYHTGNMEAYFLTGNETYRRYSEKWAEHNQWKGAPSDDKANWKYQYGESADFVLFGDWQICFQTYIDLYNLQPDERKIVRTQEVMEYQTATSNNDYWWWADGLYMVMPVMTKLYKITGNQLYLNKLYEYFSYAKQLMYDSESHLFFRDAKYIYPKHKTNSGLKDFWARGNGWVFAGLAKVLQDLPENDIHREEYLRTYRAMAIALKDSQQPEGHWTRSILDESQAPGYETSGTAFFTYGFLWGINNGILEKNIYSPVANKGWEYLTRIALQANGQVGFVQPVGERADQHKNVNAGTTADFGVGAFLLAASEMARLLNSDREYWTALLYKMAEPVLSNMSKGELKKNMQLELSPFWDGRDKNVSYMETFGRLMAGLAPWLSLPDDNTKEGKQRKQLREWALSAYAHAVNPESNDYLLWNKEGQALVDAAFLANSFLRAPGQLWNPLDEQTKKRYIKEFQGLRRFTPVYSNWVLFTAMIETFLMSIGEEYDAYRVDIAIRKIEEWYVGDGWYSDGPHFAFDYYNSYVIQPMYMEILETFHQNKKFPHISEKQLNTGLKRMQRYAAILERMISPEGTFPVFGRSMTYRMGVFQPLALLALKEQLPENITEGQIRTALTLVMKNMFSVAGNFNESGFLQLGFTGSQPDLADVYTNNGSLYLTSVVFLPLGLPADHSFWTSAPQQWTSQKAWSGAPFPKDKAMKE